MSQPDPNIAHHEAIPASGPQDQKFQIQIDRHHYTVTLQIMTGEQIRNVPSPPIGPDRDLFEVVPGGTDFKIGNDQKVEIRDGLRFFSAPAHINPGGQAKWRGI